MKKSFFSILVCVGILLSMMQISGFASDELCEYSLTRGDYVRLLGRGDFLSDGSYTFNWPNAGFEFVFTGAKAEVYVATLKNLSEEVYDGSYFNVVEYNEADEPINVTRMRLREGWNQIYDGKSGWHKIAFLRSSEACRGSVSLSKIRTDAVPEASAAREKRIEFIGDSYTAGYANSPDFATSDYAKKWYTAQTTDNWNSYTGVISRALKADNHVIAYKGKGVYINNDGYQDHTMAEQFGLADIYVSDTPNMSTERKWDFSKYQPQLVVVWLGTNDKTGSYKDPVKDIDVAQEFYNHYLAFLQAIREKYPLATVLCCSKDAGGYPVEVNRAVETMGGAMGKFYYYQVDNFAGSNIGHPTVEEDRAIAEQMLAKINNLPESIWDLPNPGENDEQALSVRADYNTNTISVFGTAREKGDFVSAVVLKPGYDAVSQDGLAYLGQTTAEYGGEYQFSFRTDKFAGSYKVRINYKGLADKKEKTIVFANYIPDMRVTKGDEKIVKMDQLNSGDDLDVTLSGFVHPTDFYGMMCIAQYSSDALLDATLIDASKSSVEFGSEIKATTKILDGTKKVKVFYMNQETLAPVIGSYVIE